MKLLGYKNISRSIMISTIVLILLNTTLISLFYYKNQLNDYDESITALRYENINEKKQLIKNDIQTLVGMLYYKYDHNSKKIISKEKEIIKWLSTIQYDTKKSDYIFIYELLDKKGGDNFAKMILNPNRPDIQNKLISTSYKDIKGFAFRQKFLDDINLYGESIVKYSYKKTNGNIGEKISYFYYFEPLNWIIAKGIYLEDIQEELEKKKEFLQKKLKKQIKQNLFFFLFFSFIAVIIAYIIGKTVQNIIQEKDKSVKKSTKALATLNKQLDFRVKQAIEKNKEQEKILMQKSKFIALGEMISLIAHQWRQPISELNAIILNLKLHHRLNKLDETMMQTKTKQIESLLGYMSQTIDDFRTFFKPNKQKEKFFLEDSITRITDITRVMLQEHHIILDKKLQKNLFLYNFQNEFEQVILNILNNAKDALVSDKITNPLITIETSQKEDQIIVKISDNAKGIDPYMIEKIFDPYFTTKEQTQGTGIGLYMSKIIIEENMKGKLDVTSSKDGTCFYLSFSNDFKS